MIASKAAARALDSGQHHLVLLRALPLALKDKFDSITDPFNPKTTKGLEGGVERNHHSDHQRR
jgi:hypothetical protein